MKSIKKIFSSTGISFIFLILLSIFYSFLAIKLDAGDNSEQDIDTITSATRLANLPVEITDISTYDALTADPQKHSQVFISYRLSKPAWVRIRIVHRYNKALVFRTLLEWSRRDKGINKEKWDFRDASGNLSENKQCLFLFDADSELHRQHDREKCHDLPLEIKEPASLRTPVITGNFHLKIALDSKSKGYSDTLGCRVRFYLDYQIIKEISYPPGFISPFDLQLDTTALKNGIHVITANVDDHQDHIGTATIKIMTKN